MVIYLGKYREGFFVEFEDLELLLAEVANIKRGVLIPLVGGDSIGKSSYLNEIKQSCPSATVLSWHNAAHNHFSKLQFFPSIFSDFGLTLHNCFGPDEIANQLFLFLNTWINTDIIPALNRGEIVVVDSYIYRFIAKEIVFYNQYRLRDFYSEIIIPKPSMVLLISNSPEIAWNFLKGKEPEYYETYSNGSGLHDFRNFQTAVHLKVEELLPDVPIIPLENYRDSFTKDCKWELWNAALAVYLLSLLLCKV